MKGLRIPILTLPVLALAACTGSGVEPSGLQPLTGEAGAQPAAAGSLLPGPAAQAGQTAAAAATALPAGPISTSARIQVAPVIGATPEAVPPLSGRIAARAAQRGIGLAQPGTTATHLLRGYFSAFTENRETTIIFVWDVLDPAGARLHRIQGQHKLPSGSQQGWRSVTPATMESIADRTVDELAAWLSARAG